MDDSAGSCELLASRCHDVGTALAKECHDLGHDGEDTKCGPRKAECLAAPSDAGASVDAAESIDAQTADDAQSSVDGGTTADGGATIDASADAAPSACETYCTCMSATCASEPGYRFADSAACLAACATFGASDRSCRVAACEEAKTAADKGHPCDHAGGVAACH